MNGDENNTSDYIPDNTGTILVYGNELRQRLCIVQDQIQYETTIATTAVSELAAL